MTRVGTAAAAAEALCAVAADDRDLVVVTGREPGLAGTLLERHPGRQVPAPGPRTRLAVAEGLTYAGKRVVTLDGEGLLPLPLGDVLLTRTASTAVAARRAGLVVVWPAWPSDVEPLLRAALAASLPVCFRVHDGAVPEDPPPSPPRLDRGRVLRTGERGVLAAAGAAVALLAPVARMLSGRGVDVTTVAVHTLAAGDGWPRPLLDGHLALAAGTALGADGRPQARLEPLPSAGASPRALMEQVLARLPAA